MERKEKINRLLATVGVPVDSIDWLYDKICNWDFILSVSSHLNTRGTITTKQREAVVNIVTNRFKIELEDTSLSHTAQYSRDGEASNPVVRQLVSHSFKDLETIQLFDLPFENDSKVSLRLYKFNSHNCVIAYNGAWYKIPLPTSITLTEHTTDIIAKYKRTAKKGFLKDITVLKHVHP